MKLAGNAGAGSTTGILGVTYRLSPTDLNTSLTASAPTHLTLEFICITIVSSRVAGVAPAAAAPRKGTRKSKTE